MRKIFQFLKPYRLIIFLSFLFVLRLPFIFKGRHFFVDEDRYYLSFSSLKVLLEGDFKQAVLFLFSGHGRPFFILLGIIPAALQFLLKPFYFPPESGLTIESASNVLFDPITPSYFDVVSLCNLLVSMAICWMLFRIWRRFIKDEKILFLGITIYALLCNSNLYIRHLFPYEYSLLLFLFAIDIALDVKKMKGVFFVGILSALGFSCYPGYALMSFFPGVLLFSKGKFWDSIRACFFYVLGFSMIIFVWQMLSVWEGTSYIAHCRKLSNSIIQGDNFESLLFLFNYFLDVEKIIGVLLLILFAVGCGVSVKANKNVQLRVLLWTAVGCYLFYALVGIVFHKVVMYGRLVHMYVPFIILGALVFLDQLRNVSWKRGLVIVLYISSIVSFFMYAPQYYSLTYPREFRYSIVKEIRNKKYWGRGTRQKPFDPNSTNQKIVLFYDAWFLYPIAEDIYPIPSEINGFKLLKQASHPQEFLAYQYEGLSREERKRFRERNYEMRVYIRDGFADKFLNNEKKSK